MAFYDQGRHPDPDKDPTKEIQWEIGKVARELGIDILGNLQGLVEASIGALVEGIGGIVKGLMGALLNGNIADDVESFLINMPGVGFLVKSIMGEGYEVGDLADFFTESFEKLADALSPESLFKMVTDFLEPFRVGFMNLLSAFFDVGDNPLMTLNPFAFLSSMLEWIKNQVGLGQANNASLAARLSALEVSGGPGVEVGFYNNCSSVAGFDLVVGTLESTFGRLRSFAVAAGHEKRSPQTDRHGAAIRLTEKRPGICRAHICSNDAMDNFAALEIRTDGNGSDYARVVLGLGPNDVVAQKQFEQRIVSDSVWEIRYDDVTNIYHTYENGVEKLELRWEDVDNTITHGPTKRRVGVLVNGLSQLGWKRGFAITDFTGYDWTAAAS